MESPKVCCLVWSEVTLSSYKSVRAINKLSALAKTSDVTARRIVVIVLASDWSDVTRPGLSLVSTGSPALITRGETRFMECFFFSQRSS